MRILLIHQFFLEDGEGGGTRWNEMSRIWTENGHEITVIAGMRHYMVNRALDYTGKLFHRYTNQDQVKVIRCYAGQSGNGFLSRLSGFFAFVFTGIWVGVFYAKEDYDVMIVSSPPLFVGLIAVFLNWWKHIPFVFEIRDLWPESAIATGMLKNKYLIRLSFWLESGIYRKAKAVAVLTPAFREILINKKKVPADKIILIPNAADFTRSDKLLSEFDAVSFRKAKKLDNRFIITYTGAHGQANHLIQILETAEMLRDTNVLFLLIGDGEQKEYLIAEAGRRAIDNVRFVESLPKDEVLKYIIASDMGTSVLKKTDTFMTIYSNKTFDYFSCKKPVLMAIDGVSRSLVEEAAAGIFVEPENPADFAEKVRIYLKNPALLEVQGENGYRFAKKHFDRQVLAKEYLNYIEHL
jgi:glycosyltransferase involved in cell wall biosynthesis